jgi:PAT family beta-lactamase induction signal transducer AmpG
MQEPSGTFGRKRVLLQLCLGFASGLPLLLTGSTLTTWMTSVGVDLKTVGIFALVGLPYSFKFTWAPLLDRYRLPLLGRRRGWLLLFQLLLIAAIAVLGASDPVQHIRGPALAALLVSFFAASQDIVTDAYRTDLLAPDERAAGTVTFVLGYRIGVRCAGALALILSETLSWRSVYLLLAACMSVGALTTLLAPEPSGQVRPPRTLLDAVVHPFRDLFSRPAIAAVVAFVIAYKFGHALLGTMASPFAVKWGFSKAEIGAVNKGLGLVASICGGLLAGVLVPRLGTRRALFCFGGLQALAHLFYLALSLCGQGPMRHTLLICAVGIDQFCTGLSMAPFDAYLMSLCDRKYSATQYALLTALSSVGARFFGAGSGYLAQTLGWPRFFLATLLLALPGLVLIRWLPETSSGGGGPKAPAAPPLAPDPAPPAPLTGARPER